MPWSILSAELPTEGIIPVFLRTLSERSGVAIEIRKQPYSRLLYDLDSGEADVGVFFRTQASEKVAHPVIKITDLPTVMLTRNKGVIHKDTDFKGMFVAIKNGIPFPSTKLNADNQLSFIKTNDHATSVRLLNFERVDAIVGSFISLSYHFKLSGHQINEYSEPFILQNNQVYFHVSKMSELPVEVKDRLKATLVELVEEKYYEMLIERAIHSNVLTN